MKLRVAASFAAIVLIAISAIAQAQPMPPRPVFKPPKLSHIHVLHHEKRVRERDLRLSRTVQRRDRDTRPRWSNINRAPRPPVRRR